ncbi:hypothetical protein OAR83_00735 [Alphaproteobacteria bacterium]|nr:hypothetical protein [Alphaproteobacteria bacterium]
MTENNYSKEELLALYLAGELKGSELSNFEDDLAKNPKLQALSNSMKELDGEMLSSLEGKDEIPEDFRNMIKERINELEAEASASSNLIAQTKSLFKLKSLIPAGAGAAFATVLVSMVAGPALVMKGVDNEGGKYNRNLGSVETDIQEMPWMLQQPALTKIIVNDKTGNYSRYLGNGTNKVEVGESFFIYVTSFGSGELSVKSVSEDGQTNTLIDKASVSIGSVIEVSDEGYPWKLQNQGRQRIQIFLNNELTETIILAVE